MDIAPLGTIQNANRTGANPSGKAVRVAAGRTANTGVRKITTAHRNRRRQISTAA